MSTQPMMVIGSSLKSDDLEGLTNAIIKIANSSPFKAVNIEALETFRHMLQVQNVTVTNCTFTANRPTQDETAVSVRGSGWDPSTEISE